MPFGPQGAIRDDDARDAFLAEAKRPIFGVAGNPCLETGKGKVQLLYQMVEKVTGTFPVWTQTTGDCVSFAGALAAEIVKDVEIFSGEAEEWAGWVATEPLYALSRVEIGRGQLGKSAGSTGGWLAKALTKYGVLLRKQYGKYDLTTYSGQRADNWGYYGLPDELEPIAKEHPMQTGSLITSYEDARDSIYNGYPVVVCSNQGFSDTRDSEGFARPQGSWAHAMCIAAIDDAYKRKGGLICNSWGPNWNRGPKRHNQPDGSFWVDADVIDKMLRQWSDSYAFSGFEGFKRRTFDWTTLWDLAV